MGQVLARVPHQRGSVRTSPPFAESAKDGARGKHFNAARQKTHAASKSPRQATRGCDRMAAWSMLRYTASEKPC
jgi:hypothetical protein